MPQTSQEPRHDIEAGEQSLYLLSRKHVVQSAGPPKKFIEFISPVVPSLCCACETGIALKLKNSSNVHINLVQGGKLGEAGELVERALDVTLNSNTPFPLFVRTVTNFYRTLSRNTLKTRKNLGKNRKSDQSQIPWDKVQTMWQRGCRSKLRHDLDRWCNKEAKENMDMHT